MVKPHMSHNFGLTTGQTARVERDIVGASELGVNAEESTPALSPGSGPSTFAIHGRSKAKSPTS